MKKILLIFTILILLLSHLPAVSFVIETSKGEKTLTVPEGLTLEEAYSEMARLYLEEKWAHEELIEQTNDLIEKSENYKTSSEEMTCLYQELLEKYDSLVASYEKKTKKTFFIPLISAGLGYNITQETMTYTAGFGIMIYEKMFFKTHISYPWEVRLEVGFSI